MVKGYELNVKEVEILLNWCVYFETEEVVDWDDFPEDKEVKSKLIQFLDEQKSDALST